ncbi:MAG: response regulator transcription factor [Anaerolineales bacterium]|nr:response regulator transcription factor [Anaerolineales bacterium]
MKKTGMIRILVVDDHTLVREGLCHLIAARPDMEVVGQASDGVEAICQAISLKPDVILMDLVMPQKDGLEAIREIALECPEARILVLTSFAEDRRVFQAIKEGALGYLLKDSSYQDLIRAIHEVSQGDISLKPSIALKVIRELKRPSDLPLSEEPLTEREVEVLKLVAQGFSNKEIACSLGISERTVTTHVSNVLGKLHLANRTQATLYAIREGLTDSPQNSK